MLQKKLCVDCGKFFNPIRKKQKLCHECVEKKKLAEKKRSIERRNKVRICAVCKTEFKSNYRIKYCSEKCAILSYTIKPKKPKMKVNCFWCHIEMLTHSPNKRFCTSECMSYFLKAKRRIHMKYPFGDKASELIKQLEKEGKDFVLR